MYLLVYFVSADTDVCMCPKVDPAVINSATKRHRMNLSTNYPVLFLHTFTESSISSHL